MRDRGRGHPVQAAVRPSPSVQPDRRCARRGDTPDYFVERAFEALEDCCDQTCVKHRACALFNHRFNCGFCAPLGLPKLRLKQVSRKLPSFAVARNCGMASRSLKADVNALNRLQSARGPQSAAIPRRLRLRSLSRIRRLGRGSRDDESGVSVVRPTEAAQAGPGAVDQRSLTLPRLQAGECQLALAFSRRRISRKSGRRTARLLALFTRGVACALFGFSFPSAHAQVPRATHLRCAPLR